MADLKQDWIAGQKRRMHPEQYPLPPGATGELTNYDPSWRDRLADLMGTAANAISGKPYDEARRDSMTLLGLAPGTGTAMAGEDAVRDLKQGDYVGAGLNALGAIPDAGPFAKAALIGAAAKGGDRGVAKEVADLFDMSAKPNVPQFDLPRYEPARGVPQRTQDITSDPAVREGMLNAIERGKSMGGDQWYNLEPLRLKFADQLGEDVGTQRFNRFMDYMAGASPRSSVPENIRNASYYYGLDVNGLPLQEPTVIPGGGRGGADKKVKNPEPYGHIAQDLHRMNFEKIRSGQGLDQKVNPKPLGFAENLKGNLQPVAVDTHAFRLPAILGADPRFLERRYQSVPNAPIRNIQQEVASGELPMSEAVKTPAFFGSQPEQNEYRAMEQFYQGLGQEAGLRPGQTQAAAWVGGGNTTGLRSDDTKTAMDFVKDRIALTAEKLGMDPRDVLARMISGQQPLLSLGAAAGAGAGAAELLQAPPDRREGGRS